MSGDEDGRNSHTLSNKLLREFDTGHGGELDVEYQAAELGTMFVCQNDSPEAYVIG